jgi:hypothetical protein
VRRQTGLTDEQSVVHRPHSLESQLQTVTLCHTFSQEFTKVHSPMFQAGVQRCATGGFVRNSIGPAMYSLT